MIIIKYIGVPQGCHYLVHHSAESRVDYVVDFVVENCAGFCIIDILLIIPF